MPSFCWGWAQGPLLKNLLGQLLGNSSKLNCHPPRSSPFLYTFLVGQKQVESVALDVVNDEENLGIEWCPWNYELWQWTCCLLNFQYIVVLLRYLSILLIDFIIEDVNICIWSSIWNNLGHGRCVGRANMATNLFDTPHWRGKIIEYRQGVWMMADFSQWVACAMTRRKHSGTLRILLLKSCNSQNKAPITLRCAMEFRLTTPLRRCGGLEMEANIAVRMVFGPPRACKKYMAISVGMLPI